MSNHTLEKWADERVMLKELNAELIKVMVQACEDLTNADCEDDTLDVRDRMQEAITAAFKGGKQ